MSGRAWIIIGALIGATGVAIGAFGAHGLQGQLDQIVLRQLNAQAMDPVTEEAVQTEVARRLETFETGVRYQMYHAPALVLVGLLMFRRPSKRLVAAGCCFLLGVLIFSGLLYVLVLSGIKILGAIVPIGGTLLIIGWLLLALAPLSTDSAANPH